MAVISCPACEAVNNEENTVCRQCGEPFGRVMGERVPATARVVADAAEATSGHTRESLRERKKDDRERAQIEKVRRQQELTGVQDVNLVAIDIPFWRLVMFLVKFIIASIPACILASFIIAGLIAFLGSLGLMAGSN